MRVLVGGGAGRAPAALEEQKRVFDEHLRPGVRKFLAALEHAAQANYYRRVAAFAAAFISLEIESFDLD
jgi:TorA maturation chaperone TorD